MRDAVGGIAVSNSHNLRWNETIQTFGLPRGARMLPPSQKINAELGTSHAMLPVVHTHMQQDSQVVGLWFHYARGCSDFLWNVGRTLLVRNKCHASVLFEKWARNSTWTDAVWRTASRLVEALRQPEFYPAWQLHDAHPSAVCQYLRRCYDDRLQLRWRMGRNLGCASLQLEE